MLVTIERAGDASPHVSPTLSHPHIRYAGSDSITRQRREPQSSGNRISETPESPVHFERVPAPAMIPIVGETMARHWAGSVGTWREAARKIGAARRNVCAMVGQR
jgi:hypothetical protein